MVLPELMVEIKVFMKDFALCNFSSFTKEILARKLSFWSSVVIN